MASTFIRNFAEVEHRTAPLISSSEIWKVKVSIEIRQMYASSTIDRICPKMSWLLLEKRILIYLGFELNEQDISKVASIKLC